MQILILYYSRTGRTQAMAEAIADGVTQVHGVQALLRTTEEVTEDDFLQSDGIIAGSPVYFGTMSAQLKGVFDRFITTRKHTVDKIGAAFTSGNHHSGGKETTLLSILQALMIYGMIIVGDPLETGGHYGAALAGDPTEKGLEDAKLLGVRVAETVIKLA
ncbi:MAG: flavodoxin family protein [Candidatus Atribacteria bacterium]|nr:MAG: flavodoxin family protein [Candidatus Atribacteria bacterium]